MPVIFYYKNFIIKFWSSEEKRPHVHALNDTCQVKFWLDEDGVHFADVKGAVTKKLINELLQEIRKHEQECKSKWREYFGD